MVVAIQGFVKYGLHSIYKQTYGRHTVKQKENKKKEKNWPNLSVMLLPCLPHLVEGFSWTGQPHEWV